MKILLPILLITLAPQPTYAIRHKNVKIFKMAEKEVLRVSLSGVEVAGKIYDFLDHGLTDQLGNRVGPQIICTSQNECKFDLNRAGVVLSTIDKPQTKQTWIFRGQDLSSMLIRPKQNRSQHLQFNIYPTSWVDDETNDAMNYVLFDEPIRNFFFWPIGHQILAFIHKSNKPRHDKSIFHSNDEVLRLTLNKQGYFEKISKRGSIPQYGAFEDDDYSWLGCGDFFEHSENIIENSN